MTIVSEDLLVGVKSNFNNLIIFILDDSSIIFLVLSSKGFEYSFFFIQGKCRWINCIFWLVFLGAFRFFESNWSGFLARG